MDCVEKQSHNGGLGILGFAFEQWAEGGEGGPRPEITTVSYIRKLKKNGGLASEGEVSKPRYVRI